MLRIFLQIELHRELAVVVYLYLGINLIIILKSLKAEDQIGGEVFVFGSNRDKVKVIGSLLTTSFFNHLANIPDNDDNIKGTII